MAALTVASTQITAATDTGSSVTVTKPVSTAIGDLLVAYILAENGVTSSPTGWTFLSSNGRANFYYVVATSTQTGASNFTWNVNGTVIGGMISRITGDFDATNPITVFSQGGVAATSTPSWSISVTPLRANSLLLFCVQCRVSSATVPTASAYAIATSDPGTWAEVCDTGKFNGSGNSFNIALAWALRAQTTGTGNASCTLNTVCDDPEGMMVVVNPSAPITGNFFSFFR